HFDHALDSPVVAMQTGALLVGSSSTANIGRGYGLPEERIRTVKFGDSLSFGRFKVHFLQSAHLPTGYASGPITAPLVVPAAASDQAHRGVLNQEEDDLARDAPSRNGGRPS